MEELKGSQSSEAGENARVAWRALILAATVAAQPSLSDARKDGPERGSDGIARRSSRVSPPADTSGAESPTPPASQSWEQTRQRWPLPNE